MASQLSAVSRHLWVAVFFCFLLSIELKIQAGGNVSAGHQPCALGARSSLGQHCVAFWALPYLRWRALLLEGGSDSDSLITAEYSLQEFCCSVECWRNLPLTCCVFCLRAQTCGRSWQYGKGSRKSPASLRPALQLWTVRRWIQLSRHLSPCQLRLLEKDLKIVFLPPKV